MSLDYSGMDDMVARRGALSGARDARFQSLYEGNIGGGVSAGNRVRDLVGELRAYGVQADDRGAEALPLPLVRPSSVSSGSNRSDDGGAFELGEDNVEPLPPPANDAPAARPVTRMPVPARVPGVMTKDRKPGIIQPGARQFGVA